MPRSKNNSTRRAQKKRLKERKKMADPQTRATIVEKAYGYQGTRMCGRKHRYMTELSAMRGGLNTYGYILNTYRCPICGGWHLTRK